MRNSSDDSALVLVVMAVGCVYLFATVSYVWPAIRPDNVSSPLLQVPLDAILEWIRSSGHDTSRVSRILTI